MTQPIHHVDIPSLVAQLNSGDYRLIEDGAARLSKLSASTDPCIDLMVQHRALPPLITILSSKNPNLIIQAASCLANIASGNPRQTHALVQCDAIPALVDLLSSENEQLYLHAITAVAEIANQSTQYRDFILRLNVMKKLLTLANKQTSPHLRCAVYRAISILGSSEPELVSISDELPNLFKNLFKMIRSGTNTVFVDVFNAFSPISSLFQNKEKVHSSIDLDDLIDLFSHPNEQIRASAWFSLLALTEATDFQFQRLIEANILQHICYCIGSGCTMSSHLALVILMKTASQTDQLDAVIEAGFFRVIFSLLDQTNEDHLKHSIALTLHTVLSRHDREVVEHLEVLGCIRVSVQWLYGTDDVLLDRALDILTHFLNYGQHKLQFNHYPRVIACLGGVQILSHLRTHPDVSVILRSRSLLCDYFGFEEPEDVDHAERLGA